MADDFWGAFATEHGLRSAVASTKLAPGARFRRVGNRAETVVLIGASGLLDSAGERGLEPRGVGT